MTQRGSKVQEGEDHLGLQQDHISWIRNPTQGAVKQSDIQSSIYLLVT